eukprot:2196356-Prymnesium_polylepis.1
MGTFEPGAIICRCFVGSPSPSTAAQFNFQQSRAQRTLFHDHLQHTRSASAFCGVKTARKWAAVCLSRASNSDWENSC